MPSLLVCLSICVHVSSPNLQTNLTVLRTGILLLTAKQWLGGGGGEREISIHFLLVKHDLNEKLYATFLFQFSDE